MLCTLFVYEILTYFILLKIENLFPLLKSVSSILNNVVCSVSTMLQQELSSNFITMKNIVFINETVQSMVSNKVQDFYGLGTIVS